MAVRAQGRSRTTAKHRAAFKVPIHVTRDEQIETAVAIVVEPSGARGPTLVDLRQLVCDVAESPIAVVVIKAIGLVAGNKKINETVVVVIRGGNAHAVTNTFETGVFGYVYESSVGFLLIKTIPILRLRFVGEIVFRHSIFERRAVGEEEIHAPVVVEVEDNDAATHGLEQVLHGCFGGSVNEVNA